VSQIHALDLSMLRTPISWALEDVYSDWSVNGTASLAFPCLAEQAKAYAFTLSITNEDIQKDFHGARKLTILSAPP
jgi:hypothetical protein